MARLVASSGLKDEDGRCPCHSEAACPLHNALRYQDHSDPAMSDLIRLSGGCQPLSGATTAFQSDIISTSASHFYSI